MTKTTMHDRLVAALLQRGEKIVPDARSTRYTVLTRTRRQTGELVGFYYVGHRGALRIGTTISDSTSVGDALKAALIRTAKS